MPEAMAEAPASAPPGTPPSAAPPAERFRVARWLLRGLVSAAIVLAIGRIAHLEIGSPPADAGLRLSLRTALARIEVCRNRTAEELAALPAHMRQPKLCEETAINYRLTVRVDGQERLLRTVTHRGVRRTRPLVVDELLRLTPGDHDLAVTFQAVPLTAQSAPGAGVPTGELPDYSLQRRIAFETGRIRLVRLEEGKLVVD